MSDVTYRPARREDCRTIADLFQTSPEGVADYVWNGLDCPGMPLIEIGAQRFSREVGPYSYRNCLIAERDGRIAGMLHAYPVENLSAEELARLRPYGDLAVPGSLKISSIAVFRGHRGLGIGAELMTRAHRRAWVEGRDVCLTCFAENRDAVRLYERFGYRVMERRPVTQHPFIAGGGDELWLMHRETPGRGYLDLADGYAAAA